MATPRSTQAAVIGAGPAGLAAGLALAALGIDVTVAAPAFDAARAVADRRTTALLLPSVNLLKNLGVWSRCEARSAPLSGIRIVDDRGGLMRAPEILFEAAELGLDSFGANIANADLLTALNAAAQQQTGLTLLPTRAVTAIVPGEAFVSLETAEGGSLIAGLVVAADGRGSLGRAAAGIAARSWTYPQAAVAASFRHTRPHHGISVELHRRSGPLTTVPLPGDASSLVWVEEPGEAQRLARLDGADFAREIEERLHGLLGAVSEPTPCALFALSGLTAERMGAERIALVGEAAHVIPPIGAQGLNLGLRDAAALAECAADALARGEDIAGPATLAAYETARTGDILTRTASVDLLNRSLLSDFLPVQALRGIGLHLLANLGPLRRLVMQGGMSPPSERLPRLMRPGALR